MGLEEELAAQKQKRDTKRAKVGGRNSKFVGTFDPKDSAAMAWSKAKAKFGAASAQGVFDRENRFLDHVNNRNSREQIPFGSDRPQGMFDQPPPERFAPYSDPYIAPPEESYAPFAPPYISEEERLFGDYREQQPSREQQQLFGSDRPQGMFDEPPPERFAPYSDPYVGERTPFRLPRSGRPDMFGQFDQPPPERFAPTLNPRNSWYAGEMSPGASKTPWDAGEMSIEDEVARRIVERTKKGEAPEDPELDLEMLTGETKVPHGLDVHRGVHKPGPGEPGYEYSGRGPTFDDATLARWSSDPEAQMLRSIYGDAWEDWDPDASPEKMMHKERLRSIVTDFYRRKREQDYQDQTFEREQERANREWAQMLIEGGEANPETIASEAGISLDAVNAMLGHSPEDKSEWADYLLEAARARAEGNPLPEGYIKAKTGYTEEQLKENLEWESGEPSGQDKIIQEEQGKQRTEGILASGLDLDIEGTTVPNQFDESILERQQFSEASGGPSHISTLLAAQAAAPFFPTPPLGALAGTAAMAARKNFGKGDVKEQYENTEKRESSLSNDSLSNKEILNQFRHGLLVEIHNGAEGDEIAKHIRDGIEDGEILQWMGEALSLELEPWIQMSQAAPSRRGGRVSP